MASLWVGSLNPVKVLPVVGMAVVEAEDGEGENEMVWVSLAIAGMLGAGAFGWVQGKKTSGLDPLWFVVAVAGGVVAGAILASKE